MVLPLLLLLLLLLIPSGATLNPLRCTGTNYTANTPYQTNLNTLLSSLASESSSTNYNNTTVGIGTNRIYGLFLCQGDLAPTDCQSCVQSATSNITAPEPEGCPGSRQAIIWYEYCMVRYSDTNFFGVVDITTVIFLRNTAPSQSPVPYEMVANLVQVAPFRRPMFASISSTSGEAMAECTDDLTGAGCSKCLTEILGTDPRSRGWQYLSSSCRIRYEVYPFLRNLTFAQNVEWTCSADNLTYGDNVNTLLSDITSKAAATGFYNDSQSQLYGLALCRGDISVPSYDCTNCLNQVSTALTTVYCPNSTQGTVWVDKCMVRYSKMNFFGIVDYSGKSYCGVEQVSNDIGDSTIAFATGLLGVAANSRLMFAANETGAGGSQPIYVLAQCSRDLSSDGCKRCLEEGMSDVRAKCKQTNGWRYLSGSCNIRYEVYPFFNTSAIEIGKSAPRPESPVTGRGVPESRVTGGGKSQGRGEKEEEERKKRRKKKGSSQL